MSTYWRLECLDCRTDGNEPEDMKSGDDYLANLWRSRGLLALVQKSDWFGRLDIYGWHGWVVEHAEHRVELVNEYGERGTPDRPSPSGRLTRDQIIADVARAILAAFPERAEEIMQRIESGLREQCACGTWKTDEDIETCEACEEKRRAEFLATLPPPDPIDERLVAAVRQFHGTEPRYISDVMFGQVRSDSIGIVPLAPEEDAVALLASRPERFVTFITGPAATRTMCRICSQTITPAADGPEALRHALIAHDCPTGTRP